MQEEYFFTGYCRCIDGSRMVTVETDGEKVTDTGCGYGSCPYEPNCQIAQKIKELA